MTWKQLPHGLCLEPLAKGPASALVVILADAGTVAATLHPVAMRWAAAVPTTAFIVLEAIDRAGGRATQSDLLDRAMQRVVSQLQTELRARQLDAGRLVLVGFGRGATLALHGLLRQGRNCAGVLALGATLVRPLAPLAAVAAKVRLIACGEDGPVDRRGLREFVALLTSAGIDARGVLLAAPPLSDEVVRHAGAYLVELVATAQCGGAISFERQARRIVRRLARVAE